MFKNASVNARDGSCELDCRELIAMTRVTVELWQSPACFETPEQWCKQTWWCKTTSVNNATQLVCPKVKFTGFKNN